MTKDEIYKKIQKYLNTPPVIIWGSGATIPYKMPSMGDLKEALGKKYPDIAKSTDNLETELGKEQYNSDIVDIKKIIWNTIYSANEDALIRIIKDSSEFNGIKRMALKFCESHPQILNIITTNYDLILEYTFAYNSINYTTGFKNYELSVFDTELFNQTGNIIKIIKVHGSINWFDFGDGTAHVLSSSNISNQYNPVIITPGNNKYRLAYREPYRDLIGISDKTINEANAFLAVGFGFNDEHLTPKVKEKTKKGCPIVLITKEITDSTRKELSNASKYILIEESDSTHCHYEIKDDGNIHEEIIDGADWKLDEFLKIIF